MIYLPKKGKMSKNFMHHPPKTVFADPVTLEQISPKLRHHHTRFSDIVIDNVLHIYIQSFSAIHALLAPQLSLFLKNWESRVYQKSGVMGTSQKMKWEMDRFPCAKRRESKD